MWSPWKSCYTNPLRVEFWILSLVLPLGKVTQKANYLWCYLNTVTGGAVLNGTFWYPRLPFLLIYESWWYNISTLKQISRLLFFCWLQGSCWLQVGRADPPLPKAHRDEALQVPPVHPLLLPVRSPGAPHEATLTPSNPPNAFHVNKLLINQT